MAKPTKISKDDALKYCVFLGHYAGADITKGNGLVIVGDNIRDLNPKNNKNTIFIGKKVAIGSHLFGKRILTKDLIEKYLWVKEIK